MPEDEQPNTFRKWRDELGLTCTEVSYEFVRAGKPITGAAINGWEQGQVPSLDNVDAIARVYKKTARQVLDVLHAMARARVAGREPAGAK